MPLHDVHYQHWRGISTGIWARRWVIARHGLTACLRNKVLRLAVFASWGVGLVTVAALFAVGQLLLPDSIIIRWVGQLNPDLQTFASMLTYWLHGHPEISVRTTQNVLLYYGCTLLTPVGVFVLGIAMPFFITRDLASSAIVIYSSKAVTRGDYLLGKFCTAFGLLTLVWLGPMCAAWFLGNLVSPDWHFFWHGRAALGNVLIYGLISMAILSALALGVSAVSSKEKSTPALWFIWWVIGFVIQPIAINTKPWLRHLSFTYNLQQIRLATFRLGGDVKTAQDNIPILGDMLRNIPPRTLDALNAPAFWGAMLALLIMLALAAWVVSRRVRPE
jgi:hypothetical protein